MTPPLKTIFVTSGYGGNTRQPFVEIQAEQITRPLQISPEEARELALNILEAAEAAEQDAFLFEYIAQLTSDERTGAGILKEFRTWRDQHGQNR